MFRATTVDGSEHSRKLLMCKDGTKPDRGEMIIDNRAEMINFREDRRNSLRTCPLAWKEQREKLILVVVE